MAQRRKRDKQTGKAILKILGDRGQILYPDGGAKPLKIFIKRYQNRPGDGHGSHSNGKHKLG